MPQTPSAPRRDALLCALLVGLALLAVFPVSAQPIWDDFSSSRTALDFARTGHIRYNGWLAPTQGWQILWGALWIRLFGFSFTVLRLSNLPLTAASIYLFQRILARFGVTRPNAVLGALALGLSPLFLPLAASYMTDIPGLFVLLLCLAMCQHAIAAPSDRMTVLWLVSASLLNTLGGTVRQTSWLGALVLVPSAAFLLRRRRGVVPAVAVCTLVSLVSIRVFLRWVSRQPYAIAEPLLPRGLLSNLPHLVHQGARSLLCLLLILTPILAAWLPSPARNPLRSLSRRNLAIALAASAAVISFMAAHRDTPGLDSWILPWLHTFILAFQGMWQPETLFGGAVTLSPAVRLVLSAAVVLISALALTHITQSLLIPKPRALSNHSPLTTYHCPLILLLPFTLAYAALLAPRAAMGLMQDRYLLPIMPCAITLLLLIYQRTVAPRAGAPAALTLALFSLYALGGAHNYFADQRASDRGLQQLLATGVPRTTIAQSPSSDGWVQLSLAGHYNDSHIRIPPNAFDPTVTPWPLPPGCTTFMPEISEPVIRPRFFLTFSPSPCLAPTAFPPIPYLAWLPPFHRAIYTGELRPPNPDPVIR